MGGVDGGHGVFVDGAGGSCVYCNAAATGKPPVCLLRAAVVAHHAAKLARAAAVWRRRRQSRDSGRLWVLSARLRSRYVNKRSIYRVFPAVDGARVGGHRRPCLHCGATTADVFVQFLSILHNTHPGHPLIQSRGGNDIRHQPRSLITTRMNWQHQ